MNIKLIPFLILPAFSVLASENVVTDKAAKEREEWTKQYFSQQGSPIPNGGVTVLPEKQMSQYQKFKTQRAKERADIKKYGFINQFLPEIQTLLNFKEVSKNQFTKTGRAADEGLRHNVQDIEMAYNFKGVPNSAISSMLGVAPSVTYVQGQGWAGAMQFFEHSGLGICSYRENNLKFSHGSAIIPEEDATHEVNGKITVSIVTGEPKSGFMYSVDWYDDNYFRELKCANKKFDQSLMSSTLELARTIDNNG